VGRVNGKDIRQMPRTDLDPLETVCRRIALNIPHDCHWQWDREFNLALTTVKSQDAVMVELPLAIEFAHQWDFSSIDEADAPVRDFFHAGVGVVPGQKVFTTDPVAGVILFAAWWPWGDDAQISLRVGLMSAHPGALASAEAKALLCSWLDIR
jgi:hypothetical protein